MKKLLVSLFALSLAGSLYAGGSCGSCSKSSEKKADKIEKEVVVEGSDTKDCDSSTKKCPYKSGGESA